MRFLSWLKITNTKSTRNIAVGTVDCDDLDAKGAGRAKAMIGPSQSLRAHYIFVGVLLCDWS
jgi:hypothetical protein